MDPHLSRAAEHLAHAVQFATVTYSDYDRVDLAPFAAFQDWVIATYPLTATQFHVRRVGPWSLCFYGAGTDRTLAPLILLAHYDVVPPGRLDAWIHDPFSGDLVDGQLWGRGTLDVKISLVSILEAVESALESGWRPTRDLWLCFGGDEEVGGSRGAGELGRYLEAQGVKNAWLVDEGGVIAQGALSWLKAPVALVGVAEKGFVNVKISVEGRAGHASMPPRHTAAGVLAQALVEAERHPFPARLTQTLEGFLKGASAYAPAALRPLLAAPRFWWPLLRLVLGANPKTAALIHTSQAITMLAASDKENVLPAQASAIVNVRILPGESSETVLAHYRKVLRTLPCQVNIDDRQHLNEPLPESSTSGPAWNAVLAAVRVAEPAAVALPYLVTAGTDTKHYQRVAASMFRIQPLVLGPEQIDLIHSPNERVSLENLNRSIRFYSHLIRDGITP